ncbi:hypothetical protein ACFQ9X_46580 [Catenulispora yoronensis]
MTVSLLGPLEVRVDGAPVTLGGARLRTLISRSRWIRDEWSPRPR